MDLKEKLKEILKKNYGITSDAGGAEIAYNRRCEEISRNS